MNTQTLIDNAATVASIYEAFGRGDIPFILGNVSDDCHWVAAGEGTNVQGGTYKGQGAAEFFKRLLGEVEISSFIPGFIENSGNSTVVAFGKLDATVRATGKQYSTDWAMRFVFNEDGMITEYQNYFDTAALYIASQQ